MSLRWLAIVGNNESAKALRVAVNELGFATVNNGGTFTMYIDEAEGDLIIDSVDSVFERLLVKNLRMCGHLHIKDEGGIRSDTEVRIIIPPALRRQAVDAIVRGFSEEQRRWRRTGVTLFSEKPTFGQRARTLLPVLAFLLLALPAYAQQPITVRDSVTGAVVPTIGSAAQEAIRVYCVGGSCSGGGGGGTVDQGTAGADPWLVTGDWLTNAQLRGTPVDVTTFPYAPVMGGAITAAGQSVDMTSGPVFIVGYMQVKGTYSGFEFIFEGTVDNTIYYPLPVREFSLGTEYAEDSITVADDSTHLYEIRSGGASSWRLRAVALTSGTVTVSARAAMFYQGQPTGNWLTNAQLRASAVAVTDGAGALNVIVDSSALPSGAATSTTQTDGTQKTRVVDAAGDTANVTGTSLDVNCASGCSSTTDGTASGNITAAAQTITASGLNGISTVTVTITGTWVGTIQIEASADGGTTFDTLTGTNLNDSVGSVLGSVFVGNTTNYAANASGMGIIRARATAWTSGTATVSLRASTGDATLMQVYDVAAVSQLVEITSKFPAIAAPADNTSSATQSSRIITYPMIYDRVGNNWDRWDSTVQAIGVTADGQPVTGAPVRIAGKDGSGNTQDIITDAAGELQVDVLTLPALPAGTNNIGDVDVLSFPDNEPFNVAQINGVTPLMGVGASGTGAQRTAALIHDGTDTAQVTTTNGGSLQVELPASNTISIGASESVAAPTAATWYQKRRWDVPASAVFVPSRAQSTVTTAGTRTLIAVTNNLGSFNVSTNAFTDGNSVASPRHYSRLFACVTVTLSAAATNVTVTYTAHDGTAGRTTTALTIPASAPAGNCFEFVLAVTAGLTDAGVRDVTAVSDSAAPTGTIVIRGLTTLLETMGVANALEATMFDDGQVVFPEDVEVLFFQAAVTAQQRSAHISGSIR